MNEELPRIGVDSRLENFLRAQRYGMKNTRLILTLKLGNKRIHRLREILAEGNLREGWLHNMTEKCTAFLHEGTKLIQDHKKHFDDLMDVIGFREQTFKAVVVSMMRTATLEMVTSLVVAATFAVELLEKAPQTESNVAAAGSMRTALDAADETSALEQLAAVAVNYTPNDAIIHEKDFGLLFKDMGIYIDILK